MMVSFLLLACLQFVYWSLGLFGATQQANPRYLSVRGCQAPNSKAQFLSRYCFQTSQFNINSVCVVFLPGHCQSMLLEHHVFQSVSGAKGEEADQTEPWGRWVPQWSLGNAMYSVLLVWRVSWPDSSVTVCNEGATKSDNAYMGQRLTFRAEYLLYVS